jgi:hypothetical protein
MDAPEASLELLLDLRAHMRAPPTLILLAKSSGLLAGSL